MKQIKAILFDLGRVIVGVHLELLVKGFSAYGKLEEKEALDYFSKSKNYNLYQEGKLTSSQFYMRTVKIFRLKIKYNEFYKVWNGIFSHSPEMENIITNIKEKHPDIKMVLISDTNKSHFEFIRKQYDILDELDDHVLSYETGKQKPSAKIFNEALKRAGALPKDTLYVDDRQDLIEGGRVMGLRAYQFTDPGSFRKQLAKFDVLV
ncbi:MAG: HAD family phosphatase [Candidatus Omnitrophica bacterium]|nr:HAD family phosphatase [Candidatus Omnitrophota bacterium]